MKVISLKNTRKLVKGSTYEVLTLRNKRPTNNQFFRPFIFIKDIGRSVPNSFTLENGDPIPEIDYISEKADDNFLSYVEHPEKIKVGDILKCRRGSTYLEFGKLYKVDEVDIKKINNWYDVKVKVGGYNRWLSIYNFSTPTQRELREISISSILDNQKLNFNVDLEVRIIDKYEPGEKNKILTSVLFKSILDPSRNTLDILDWAIQKIEPKMKLTREDFGEIMKKSIHQICLENEKK